MRQYIDLIEEGMASDPNDRLYRWIIRSQAAMDGELSDFEMVKPNTWLIHFSDEAKLIAQTGFLRGTPLKKLGGVAYGSEFPKPGYNYAFAADDEYSLRTLVEYATFGGEMREAVMFRVAGGVSCTHTTDNFSQVIFWGKSVVPPLVHLISPPPEEDDEDTDDLEPHDRVWMVGDQRFDDLFAAMTWVENHIR